MDQTLAQAVLEDYQTAPISPQLRALLGFLKQQTHDPESIERADIRGLRAAGVSDGAIRDALYIAFCFNVITRLADAFDYPLASRKNQLRTARYLRYMGYWTASLPE